MRLCVEVYVGSCLQQGVVVISVKKSESYREKKRPESFESVLTSRVWVVDTVPYSKWDAGTIVLRSQEKNDGVRMENSF